MTNVTKIHHSAQPPHEICILFNYSRPFHSTSKIWPKISPNHHPRSSTKWVKLPVHNVFSLPTCENILCIMTSWNMQFTKSLCWVCLKDERQRTWPTIYTIDRVKKTRKDCGYRLTKTRWILPLLSAMSVDGAPLLKGWQPIIVNFSEKFTIRYNIYMHILYCII